MGIRSLGRYEVRSELGRGTMGVVYRGYDPVLDREIALKTVELPAGLEAKRRARFLERFFLEAKIAAKLIHPNIVVTHDAATDETTSVPFIAMELVSGDSLHARLERGHIAWREALALVEPLATALDYAHRADVVHRDIKPANVMLTADGVPKIADFGIAKLPGTHLTQSGKVMGTPYFMSPEQLEGDEVDGRSDLFSLGALLYNLLTATPPFRGNDLASITQQVLYKSPIPPSEVFDDIPADLDAVVARIMAKDPAARYQNGKELVGDIARLAAGEAPDRPLSFGEKTLESHPAPPPTPSSDEPDGAVDHDPVASSSSTTGCFAMLVVVVAMLVAGAAWRWEDVQGALAPFRAQRQEMERRTAVRAEARRALDMATDGLAGGDYEGSRAFIDEALAHARDARDGQSEAEGLTLSGRLEAELGEWSRARADFDASATVFAIYDLPDKRALVLVELASLERDLGRFDVASALYDEAAAYVDTTSPRAMLSLLRGDWQSAERGFEQSGELLYAGAVAFARGEQALAEKRWGAHPDEARAQKWRDQAALVVRNSGDSGDSDESVLQTLFRAEPDSARSRARRQWLR